MWASDAAPWPHSPRHTSRQDDPPSHLAASMMWLCLSVHGDICSDASTANNPKPWRVTRPSEVQTEGLQGGGCSLSQHIIASLVSCALRFRRGNRPLVIAFPRLRHRHVSLWWITWISFFLLDIKLSGWASDGQLWSWQAAVLTWHSTGKVFFCL